MVSNQWSITPKGLRSAYILMRGTSIVIMSSRRDSLLDCGFAPGSYCYVDEDQDIATFAEWGIDFLKYDKLRGRDIRKFQLLVPPTLSHLKFVSDVRFEKE
ncbi:uncharacterized protein BT62DRAFT_774457 [Guyanagaster necrorhizus]|uniref:alpha-galactosidase n=1 Tax=Guyanagaster necrorhizus TaxID=856835 RepID=A0A9P8ATH3_9AGAR|nr:uncharacterized protein BT62DRAFT_774457 [Guyanagaster necrorhizus MCA 3950]KAG7447438.1 hypothetical protein BT62DRAFT_774457 [Guyanagaster necrorhizus MCA 3950]